MAGRASGIDQEQERIGVAVDPEFEHTHHVAGGRPLVPQFAPATTPEMGFSGVDGRSKRIGIHPGDHQNSARLSILYHGREQTALIPFEE